MDRIHAITVHRNESRVPARRMGDLTVSVPPVTDIYESEREYVIRIDLPGASRETIHVEVARGSLSVTADIPAQRDMKEQVLHREIHWNRFARSFTLGPGINDGGIAAETSDGVLTVRVPKTDAARIQEIPVR